MTKTIYQNLVDLALEYLEYSYSKFGWKRMRINKINEDSYCLTNGYADIGFLYFSEDSDHRAVTFGDVNVALYNIPNISFPINSNLKEVFKKHKIILQKIKEFHNKETLEEEQNRKQELKNTLLKQLESLN